MLRSHKLTENTQQRFTFYGLPEHKSLILTEAILKKLAPGAF